MIGIPGNDDVAPLLGSALGEVLHPGDKRTGRIDHLSGALFQLTLHLWRNTVSADHRD